MTGRASGLKGLVAISLIAVAPAATADVSRAIAQCRAAVAADEEREFDLVATNCPDLLSAIAGSNWAAAMPPDWQDTLTIHETSGLGWFEALYRTQRVAGNAPAADALDRIVGELGDQEPPPDTRSLWERFTDWLRELGGEREPEAPGWLSRWLSEVELPTRAIEVTFWVLTAVIIVAAIAVIVIEVRAARGAASRRFEHRSGADAGEAPSAGRPRSLQDLERAAPEEQPSILLELLLDRLDRTGVVKRRPSITHREVGSVAAGLPDEDGEALTALSSSAERIRFGDGRADPGRQGDVIAAGIALLGRLEPRQA